VEGKKLNGWKEIDLNDGEGEGDNRLWIVWKLAADTERVFDGFRYRGGRLQRYGVLLKVYRDFFILIGIFLRFCEEFSKFLRFSEDFLKIFDDF
jgi:hypothetical protein